jgi:hypothetical protein
VLGGELTWGRCRKGRCGQTGRSGWGAASPPRAGAAGFRLTLSHAHAPAGLWAAGPWPEALAGVRLVLAGWPSWPGTSCWGSHGGAQRASAACRGDAPAPAGYARGLAWRCPVRWPRPGGLRGHAEPAAACCCGVIRVRRLINATLKRRRWPTPATETNAHTARWLAPGRVRVFDAGRPPFWMVPETWQACGTWYPAPFSACSMPAAATMLLDVSLLTPRQTGLGSERDDLELESR